MALDITFQLCRTSVTIREQGDVPEILNVQMVDLSSRITQRPGAQAFRRVSQGPHAASPEGFDHGLHSGQSALEQGTAP